MDYLKLEHVLETFLPIDLSKIIILYCKGKPIREPAPKVEIKKKIWIEKPRIDRHENFLVMMNKDICRKTKQSQAGKKERALSRNQGRNQKQREHDDNL